MKRFAIISIITLSLGALVSMCGTARNGKGFNLFTIDQDRQLGAQVATEIDGDPAHYPLLDSVAYKDVYAYIYKIRDAILNSGNVAHRDDFKWRVRIIHDDNTLNAFCTPGGYIYVYTGILKYMDNEAELAGVLGHEIGHADLRHSTKQMTEVYGVQTLLQILAGNNGRMIQQVATSIVGLKFSRSHEKQADEASVRYLCPTTYKADGGAGFFEKMQNTGDGSSPPEFLSTHPNPEGRIEHFHEAAAENKCQGTNDYATEYKRMIARLP